VAQCDLALSGGRWELRGGGEGGWEAKSLNAIISVTRSRMTFELRQLMGHDVGHLLGEKIVSTPNRFWGRGKNLF
jgi:hypothetical protein